MIPFDVWPFPSVLKRNFLALLLLAAPNLSFSGLQLGPATPQASQQIEARNALNEGVQAFKNGQYTEAERAFARAKELDPKSVTAGLYLATAHASQYIPGSPSEDNLLHAQDAIREFKSVLAIDPQNIPAIDGLGSILFQTAGSPFDPDVFEESKAYHKKHIELRPDDPESYYWIGVIDWTLAFRANGLYRAKHNLTVRAKQVGDNEPLPETERQEYALEYGPLIDEGVENLKKALQLQPDYDEAMAYLNLLYRRKADATSDESERTELLRMADELVDQVKDIKQKRAEARTQ